MVETNNREVKADVEVINLEDNNEETEETTEDETVIPPVEEGKTPEAPQTTTEAPESSPEEKEEPEATPETKEEAPDSSTFTKKEPAPVPGETPREKALRLEIQRLKQLRREDGINKLVGNKPNQEIAQDKLKELKDLGYTDEEILNMEKAIDILATKKGYVKAEQTYQSTVNSVVESFIDLHPEYKPENDPEDVRWTRFEALLQSGIYNIAGKTPKQLNEIFRRVHKDVVDELGEATMHTETKQKAAKIQKIQSISHSGGTKTTPEKKTSKIDPTVRSFFKGFDDEDLE